MLTYSMNDRGSRPLYEYLYHCIRQDILSGILSADERLPSKRALAEHLQISVITVETAYQQLEAEGYLYVRPRRGFFVSRIDRLPESAPPAPVLPRTSAPAWKLDLRSNQVDASRFPASIWAKLTRQVLSEGSASLVSPVPHQGLSSLRQAIADHLRDFKGLSVSPEQIVVGASAEYLYLLLAQLLGQDSIFAVEDPGYQKIRRIYRKCGIALVPIPLDQQGVDAAALQASGAHVLHISPSHHYPTGIITSISRRQALLRWAEEQDATIIEDDYDSEFRFTGRPIPSLQSIDQSGRVIYMNTFSQTISPSMRVGFMVLPPRLLDRYRQELGFYACTVPALDQHVLARFLARGHYEQHLSRMRKEYRTRREAVLSAFRAGPFAKQVTILEQGAGLHFLLKLHTRQDEAVIRQKAETLGVRLSFLSEYSSISRPEYTRTLVINYAGLDETRLDETVSLLSEILAE